MYTDKMRREFKNVYTPNNMKFAVLTRPYASRGLFFENKIQDKC